MSFGAFLVAALALFALAAAVTGRVGLDGVGIVILLVLVGCGVLELPDAVAGFSNGTVLTLAGLYVIGEALNRTGALEFVAASVIRRGPTSETWLLLTVCYAAALVSSLVSDTAVVLVFLPLAIGIARDRGIALSHLLLPVAYSALLGGTLTLVGSTINLLASGVAQSYGLPPIGFFEMAPIAAPLVLLGVPLVVLLARRLLPQRASMTQLLAAHAREYVAEATIPSGSALIGQRVDAAFAQGARPLLVARGHRVILAVGANAPVLQEGDVVMLQGQVHQLADLHARTDLQALGATIAGDRPTSYFEIAVAPHATVIGTPIGELDLQRDYGVVVAAVLRGQRRIRERTSQLELRAGDVLLVCGDDECQPRLRASNDYYVLTGRELPLARGRLARRALAVIAAVVIAFVLAPILGLERLLPIPLVSLAGAAAMVASGCISARRAYQSIDWRILVFVAGALALGRAMATTGLAETCAHGCIVVLSPWGPLAVASGLFALGTVLNQFTSPYAVMLLLTPIAITAARDMGADVRPFVLAVAFAGSNAFATPMGHQVNLMVMGPGGYRYSDYLRVGLPLCVFAWIAVTVGLAVSGSW